MEFYDPRTVIQPIIDTNRSLIKDQGRRSFSRLIDLIMKQSYDKIDYNTAKVYLEELCRMQGLI